MSQYVRSFRQSGSHSHFRYYFRSFSNSKIFKTGYGNVSKPCSSIEKRSFSGLVTSRTTYFCVIYIEIAHIMLRRNIISQKEKR